MNEIDIPILSAIKQKIDMDQNGYLLYVMLSGAHLYGFASKDSDRDYRGCFVTDIHHLLGLHHKHDVIEMNEPADIVLFELAKEVGLALKGNCNVLEHLFATPIYSTPEYLELRQLIDHSWGKRGVYKSYRGMAMFNYKKFIHREGLREDQRSPINIRPTASPKKYLYVLRALMSGIFALKMGHFQPNLKILNNTWFCKIADELIEAKEYGFEKGKLPSTINHSEMEIIIDDLFQQLDQAYIESMRQLKPSQEQIEKIHRFIINLRKERLQLT